MVKYELPIQLTFEAESPLFPEDLAQVRQLFLDRLGGFASDPTPSLLQRLGRKYVVQAPLPQPVQDLPQSIGILTLDVLSPILLPLTTFEW